MYLPYQPISKKPDSSTFVPFELLEAQKIAISKIDSKIRNSWDEWVSNQLHITQDELWLNYSSEQIDSIGICIYKFLQNSTFIIGDETGIGKGRILSGISRWAWKNNKKVLFFTEREHLMSEFWKDLYDTNNISLISNPISFHSKSKVYNPDLTVAIKSNMKQVKEIEENGFSESTNLVMTNYSQISLKQHKEKKYQCLEKYCENAIIILDESHNATGDSNTNKFLLKLLENNSNVVFSSATFIKDESQFEIYEKSFTFDNDTLQLMKKLLSKDYNGTLRKIFTYELTKNLQFWRREHEPLKIGWQTIFCQNENEINTYISSYSDVINGLFQLVNLILKKSDSIESQIVTNAWFSLGATINRLSRNLLLILKTQTLIDSVKKSLENNHKAVIVIDSTLSSMIKKIHNKYLEENPIVDVDSVDDEFESNEESNNEYLFNFQQAVIYVINEILQEYIEQHKNDDDIQSAYLELINKTSIFNNLTISPIDFIKNKLALENIECGEISGRKFFLNNSNKIETLKIESKTKVVKDFNNGKFNVLIITRAGASGISAHSSAAFEDTRVRDLFELEITNRPTYRLQFMGRVNRKNQVHQPLFFSIASKLPFEQRILNIEQNKLQTLQSHISGDDSKLNQENIVNLFNEYTNKCTFDFLKNNPQLAYQMGISLKSSKPDLYYIDSLLKRCIVLPQEKQNFLYDFLISTVEIFDKLNVRKNIPLKIEINEIKTFWHQLDEIQQAEFKKNFAKFPNKSINQFKYPWVGIANTKYYFETDCIFEKNLQIDFNKNLQNQETIKQTFSKITNFLVKTHKYPLEFINSTANPIINHIALGDQLILKTDFGKIYGYIHNIELPKIHNPELYPNLILIKIKSINPHINENIYYAKEYYYLTLLELIEAESLEINKKPINWTQYCVPAKALIKDNFCLVGHPVYLQFLQNAYNIGNIEYIKFNNENKMCLVMPKLFNKQQIDSLKKPIYQTNKIMELFISRKITGLTTSWRDEIDEKSTFKIDTTTGGYNIYIAQEVSKDNEVIDFPLRKKLNNYKGRTKDGYLYYFVTYKEIRTLLFMFEKRDVIWFMNRK